jgi:hypothetical protein
MITDKQLEDVARVVVSSRRGEHPTFIYHLAESYLAASLADRSIIEKAWEPIIKKFDSLKNILIDPQTVGWMNVILSPSIREVKTTKPESIGRISVGYFGVPGGEGGITHLAQNDKPMCGVRMNPNAQFQWCSSWDNMTPECTNCKRIHQRLWARHHAANKAYGKASKP